MASDFMRVGRGRGNEFFYDFCDNCVFFQVDAFNGMKDCENDQNPNTNDQSLSIVSNRRFIACHQRVESSRKCSHDGESEVFKEREKRERERREKRREERKRRAVFSKKKNKRLTT